MFINGQIKKLQLFWVDRQNKDKVRLLMMDTDLTMMDTDLTLIKVFVQLTLEQARSEHLFIIKGYRWYRDIQVS